MSITKTNHSIISKTGLVYNYVKNYSLHDHVLFAFVKRILFDKLSM